MVECNLNIINIEKNIYNVIKENSSIEKMAINSKVISTRITNLANSMRTIKTVTHINCK